MAYIKQHYKHKYKAANLKEAMQESMQESMQALIDDQASIITDLQSRRDFYSQRLASTKFL
eukprot:6083991-Prorocentrum_lima.AAC.1